MSQTITTAGPRNRYVYVYRKPDGETYYVGKGSGNRSHAHLRAAKDPSRKARTFVVKVTRGLLSQGALPTIEKIAVRLDDEFAFFIEEECIRKFGRRDIGTGVLANCTAGGDGVQGASDASKATMLGNLNKGAAHRFTKGMTPHNFGVPVTDAVKANLRALRLGKKHSAEARLKISRWQSANNRLRGVPMSPETKEKISVAKRGIPAPWSAKPMTLEIRAKIAATNQANAWLCPHCAKAGSGISTRNRWHFNNCKFKEIAACNLA